METEVEKPERPSKDIRAALDIDELRRLYVDKEWTLARIGKKFGISRQAIQLRLSKAGIKGRTHQTRYKNPSFENLRKALDFDAIVRTYEEKKISICKLSKQLGISNWHVKKILLSKGVKIRPGRSYGVKHSRLYSLETGKSIVVRVENMKFPVQRFHNLATRKGMKVSYMAISPNSARITRLK